MRVLIVEDNKDVADLIKTIVDQCGHHPWVAYEGPSAIAIARNMSPEFVLTDIAMPGMDGYELAAKLRSLLGSEVPIYAISSFPEDKAMGHQVGMNGHVRKPVSMKHLKQLLDCDTE
ncbi:MAG: response regulator [Planctomycetota bacterium]|nr:response regulator [Planctomycetota bacterium]